MRLTLTLVSIALALSLCNLTGRRAKQNAADAAPGVITESSATPTPEAQKSNRNDNVDRTVKVQTIPTPPSPPLPRDVQTAPKAGNPGLPSTSLPGSNYNSAASVPQAPKIISGGVLNGKAISLPKPAYPPIAKAARASGAVNVQVTVDESGAVISARAVSGHPLLQQAATSAARGAKFRPTLLSGQPVKVTGVIVYNFVEQ
jgi:TonB family protein